jgi:LEA14-like dessication related protein
VEPENVRFAGIGLRGATMIADLRIENPNEFPIQTDSITFTLEASAPGEPGKWTRVTSGANHERLRIGAQSTTTAGVPIELGYSDLSGPINSVLDKGTFNYRIRGQVLLREPHRRKVPFSKTGRLSLSGGS